VSPINNIVTETFGCGEFFNLNLSLGFQRVAKKEN
jgi:hypothetical protein